MAAGPTTGVLDDCCRPDESPLSWLGTWAVLDTSETSDLALSGQTIINTAGTAAQKYWTRAQFSDFEVFAEVRGITNFIYLTGRIGSPGGNSTYTGYQLQAGRTTMKIRRADGASGFIYPIKTIPTLVVGDQVMMRGFGSYIEGWYKHGGVWSVGTAAVDSTYTSGYIGCGSQTTTDICKNFGGGTYVPGAIQPNPLSVSSMLRN